MADRYCVGLADPNCVLLEDNPVAHVLAPRPALAQVIADDEDTYLIHDDRDPDEREVFEGCVKEWDREAVLSAFQAIASHLATLTPGSAEIDALRKGLATEIERMTADGSARPTRGFATDVAMRWCALGFDVKRLFGIAMAGVYK